VIPLIALKLAGIIDWSWYWVLAPLWSSVVIFVALIGGLLLLLIRSQRPQI
jgi:phosphoglycerol transferase MdoB-like AlkP superfamily enzyme